MNKYTDKSDGTLVELSLLGEQYAYEELVRRYEKAVKGTAYKVTGNQFSAEDASQDAFVSAWMKLDGLREREKFGPWVCAIAKNCAKAVVTHYRNTCGEISLHLLENTEALGLRDERAEQQMDLQEALETLSDKIRQTVELHYFEGLSVKEIAEELGLPIGTVKWRLSEGRKLLRKEYGVMNERMDEMTFVEKVMYQVEQLKLWGLKNDRSGVEAEYRMVLKNVESLEDSPEKQYALADVLLRGYWWIPGEKNDETFARIKQAALDSHNEDVMQSVMAYENDKLSKEQMREQQIPFLEKNGFVEALAYEWFWLGYAYVDGQKEVDKALECYRKVMEISKPGDLYYANAKAAIAFETVAKNSPHNVHGTPTGELYKNIGGKWYFWSQPGYSRGDDMECAEFWNCSQVDSLILDPEMEDGQVLEASDGKIKMTFKGRNFTVETPAGKFENCICTVLEGERYGLTYAETYFAPGVGIVKQKVNRQNRYEWFLTKAEIKGGEGYLPFATGNRWEYGCVGDPDVIQKVERVLEITGATKDSVTVAAYLAAEDVGYSDTFRGNCLAARHGYFERYTEKAIDVRKYTDRAVSLAVTEREKAHAAVAKEVMERILLTNPDFNPETAVQGVWNFFCYLEADKEKRKFNDNRSYSFEWKCLGDCGEQGWKLLYSFMFDRLEDDLGTLWSDEWVPGYHMERKGIDAWNPEVKIVMDVLEDETVEVAAGRFENCRHVTYTAEGFGGGMGYGNGKKHYWFAPGVGVVRFETDFWGGTKTSVWELVTYRGRGEGYFPMVGGLFRRYEPIDISGIWHGALEHTYVEDEDGLLVLHNGIGYKDRE